MKNMEKVFVNIEEKLYERVSSLTMTDYGKRGNEVSVNSLISMIEDLLGEYGRLEEELEDTINDMESNYKPIPVGDLYN